MSVKVLRKEDAVQARREARAEFERILVAAQRRPPTPEQMDAWWPEPEPADVEG